jgi:hypothetical protein
LNFRALYHDALTYSAIALPKIKRYNKLNRRPKMSNAELLIEEIKALPDDYAAEALDFVGYLKEKAAKRQEGCPICARHRDPVTGELRFKPEIMAGMQEVEDMISGKIPTKWYNSLEEMLEDLDK